MKRLAVLITTILFSLLLVSCSSKDSDNYKTEKEIIKSYGYKELKVYQYTYNKVGEPDPKSKKLESQYTYDNEGNIVIEEFLGDNEYHIKAVYQYNNNGLVIEKQNFINDELIYTTKCNHNDKGLFIEETLYDAQGELAYKFVYEYEAAETKGYTAKVYEYKYDFGEIDSKSKNLIKQYTYDDHGNIVEENFWGRRRYYIGRIEKTVYKYNDKGFVIETQNFLVYYDNEEKLVFIFKHNHNDKGLLVEKTSYYAGDDKPKTKFVYEYK
jgi:hypothetical protein